jgi:hypothetical protein
MRRTLLAVCGAIVAMGLGPVACAQAQQTADAPPAQAELTAPGRGLSMAQVESRYGTPTQKVSPVGNPPIARWVYPTFVVYFEGHHVIHAVATQPGTAPGK